MEIRDRIREANIPVRFFAEEPLEAIEAQRAFEILTLRIPMTE